MTTEDIIDDLISTTKEIERLQKEKFCKVEEYLKILNDRYTSYIGTKIPWDGQEYYITEPWAYFCGFEKQSNGGSTWAIIPILYQARKDGTQGTRKHITFEGNTKKVIDLLENNDRQ